MPEFAHNLTVRKSGQSAAQTDMSAIRMQQTLPALIATFAEICAQRGGIGHLCLEKAEDGARILFGDRAELLNPLLQANRRVRSFDIRNWDGRAVTLLVEGQSAAWDSADHAHIALLATSYVHRGLTMTACDDWTDKGPLTKLERQCLAHHLLGQCHLEIADHIERSPHVVELHLERAVAKLDCATLADAVTKAAATGQLTGIAVKQAAG